MFSTVFVDGKVQTPEDFLRMMQAPANIPVFACHEGGPFGVAWLNGCSGRHAWGHFMFLKGGRGEIARRAGRLILSYWFSFGGERPIFDVILGMVPAWNVPAVNYAIDIGLTRLGEIPKIVPGGAGTVLYITR